MSNEHKPNGKSGTVNRIFRCKRCAAANKPGALLRTVSCDVFRRFLYTDRMGSHKYAYTSTGPGSLPCGSCGRDVYGVNVKGIKSDRHTCGARCLVSFGPDCTCSCGGKNHGIGFALLSDASPEIVQVAVDAVVAEVGA